MVRTRAAVLPSTRSSGSTYHGAKWSTLQRSSSGSAPQSDSSLTSAYCGMPTVRSATSSAARRTTGRKPSSMSAWVGPRAAARRSIIAGISSRVAASGPS